MLVATATSRVTLGAPNLGVGYELDAIAAVVIGGASLLGGRGSIWATACSVLHASCAIVLLGAKPARD